MSVVTFRHNTKSIKSAYKTTHPQNPTTANAIYKKLFLPKRRQAPSTWGTNIKKPAFDESPQEEKCLAACRLACDPLNLTLLALFCTSWTSTSRFFDANPMIRFMLWPTVHFVPGAMGMATVQVPAAQRWYDVPKQFHIPSEEHAAPGVKR
jgi:hypothetical protein